MRVCMCVCARALIGDASEQPEELLFRLGILGFARNRRLLGPDGFRPNRRRFLRRSARHGSILTRRYARNRLLRVLSRGKCIGSLLRILRRERLRLVRLDELLLGFLLFSNLFRAHVGTEPTEGDGARCVRSVPSRRRRRRLRQRRPGKTCVCESSSSRAVSLVRGPTSTLDSTHACMHHHHHVRSRVRDDITIRDDDVLLVGDPIIIIIVVVVVVVVV